jgi:2-C-methyl-D-erythritol 4-phosphate cytidylyltransferase
MDQFAVIMPAAGRSARFGGPKNKLFEEIADVTVFRRALDAFLRRKDVACIVIATGPGQTPSDFLGDQSSPDSRLIFTPGGSSRAESVFRALKQVPERIGWVAVHDAARPLISQNLIDRTFAAALQHGAAVPALAVPWTIKQATGPLPAKVQRTLPRHELWAMQTPQVMRRKDLLAAYERSAVSLEQVTDDVQLLELAGKDVWLVEGEERNLKITTQTDLQIARMLVAADEKQSMT